MTIMRLDGSFLTKPQFVKLQGERVCGTMKMVRQQRALLSFKHTFEDIGLYYHQILNLWKDG